MIPDVTSIANLGSKATPKEVSEKVQGMFTEVMLKSMEESVDAEGGLFGDSASADIYRGMFTQQLAATMTKQMKSPLEGQLDKALNKSSAAHGGQTDSTESEPGLPASGLPASGLPVSGVISSPEGWRRDPINGETRYHTGTDIAAPAGTPIRAVADGRVIESGLQSGYGNTVAIQAEDGRKMLYAHNKQSLVQTGDWVSRGEEIAEVGSTGRATGPHVHYEVKF